MSFEDEINRLENLEFNDEYIYKLGSVPVLFTAPHTMPQVMNDGTYKCEEVYTKAIALYLNQITDASYLIKVKDTGEDANRDNDDDFKKKLIEIVKENNIKLVIDLHGSKRERDYDVEFGTLNNKTSDFDTILNLERTFNRNNILNIKHNEPFKGGAITSYLYNLTDVQSIQLEINRNYRDEKNIDTLELIVKSLIEFVNEFYK